MLARLLALAWLGLLSSTPAAEAQDQDPEGPRPSSHERMVRQLERYAGLSRDENPFLEAGQVETLRARLESLPLHAPVRDRIQLMQGLGYRELAGGNVDQAIAWMEQAYALLPRDAEGRHLVQDIHTILYAAVAHLRKGEVDNCIGHCTGESCVLPFLGTGRHQERAGSEQAIRYLREILQLNPGDLPARWLMGIAAMTLGAYPDDVPAEDRLAPEAYGSDAPFPRFRNVAPEAGLDQFDLCGGAVVEDFDRDGYLDVFTSTWDTAGPSHLFHSQGDGTFEDRSEAWNLAGITGGLNAMHADVDNDGWSDVLVLRGAWMDQNGRMPNSLLMNRQGRRFEDMAFDAGLANPRFPTQAGGFADFDRDGDLDLYVGNEARPNWSLASQLYQNRGDGTFEDVAEAAGVLNRRYAKGVAWGDYDNDGDPDLYVTNQDAPNRLYRNEGDGSFTDVAPELGVAEPAFGFPCWWFDYDNDGHLDLFAGSYDASTWYDVATSYLGGTPGAGRARLYHNDGRGGFAEVGVEAGLSRVTMPMGANYGDLDHDGWPDFYLGTGAPPFEGLMPNVMFHNVEGRRFVDVTLNGGFGHLQKGHGVVFADLDNDGDQDVFHQIGGWYPSDGFFNALFENPGFGNHWLGLFLEGVESNRSAFGTRVRVDLQEGDRTRSVHHRVGTGGSFGANPSRQQIGLGQADRILRLEVRWPGSGRTQVFEDVPRDRFLRIRETDDAFEVVEVPRFRFR